MSRRDQFDSRSAAAVRYVAQRGLLKSIVWSNTRVRVEGRERVEAIEGAFIVVANHSSHLDTPLIQGALPSRLSTKLASGAAADYFFDVKWRRIITGIFFNTFPIDRGTVRTRPGMSKSLLARGVPLLIYPEGSRTKTGEMADFKPGAAALSISCDVPIVPVGIVGSYESMPRGRSWPKPGRTKVAVIFGEPMRARKGESAEAFSARVQSTVAELHRVGQATRTRSRKGRR
jgi:1-acyl-sn-glycerol-3-phosphate acyltransferase